MPIIALALIILTIALVIGFVVAKFETRRLSRITASMQADAMRAAFYRAATRPVRY